MLSIQPTSFKAVPTNSNINYSYKNQVQTQPMQEDLYDLQLIDMDKQIQKKQKRKENLEKWGVYGTVAIGAALVGQLLFSIMLWAKSKKSPMDSIDKEMTTAKLLWEDFKNSKTVAPLNSKTTAKNLKTTFKNIINSSNLSEKANFWGGGKNKKVDIIYLYGHGGTGKTYVAKQYAQEIDAIFTNVKYPDIGSPYKDAASMKISNLFDQIIETANNNKDRKIVVCIDEIDAVIKKVNDAAQGSEEASKSRAAVLTGLDRLREKCSNVTVIATSNYHPKNGIVDDIALRRFNNQVEVPLPDKEQIGALLEMYLKDIGAIKSEDFVKKSDVKRFIEKLQNECYSNGEIELIAQEAGKIFRGTLKDVPDADLNIHKHPFKVEYLEEALKMKGDAASKTNKLMTVNASSQNSKPLSVWQKILLALANIN